MNASPLDTARQYWLAGDLDRADAECRRLLEADPGQAEAWRLRAMIALRQNDIEKATRLLEAGLEATDDKGLIRELVTAHIRTRHPAQARRWLEAWEPFATDTGDTALQHALCDWMEGEHLGALDHFRAAVRANPGNRQYPVRLAKALASMGLAAEAAAQLRPLLGGPANAGVYELMTLCTFDLEGTEAAQAMVRDGLSHGSNPNLMYLMVVLQALAEPGYDLLTATQGLSLENARNAARWRSFLYARKAGPQASWHGLDTAVLEHALAAADPPGLVCEFGVYQGLSLRYIAERVEGPVHGFDSFQGLPEAWKEDEAAGSYTARGHLPRMPASVTLHPGWFEDTLPGFVGEAREPLRLVHIDCDIYSSTATVLDNIRPLLQKGTIIVFDEYMGYPGYEEHEFRAWREFSAAHELRYEYLAFNLMARKTALRVTEIS